MDERAPYEVDPPSPAVRERPRELHRRKILVVDDEEDARAGLTEILRLEGYSVDQAATAEDALEHFRTETYHLLLTDLLLPGKSGVELTKIVHDACPAT